MTDISSTIRQTKFFNVLSILLITTSTILMISHSKELATFAKNGMHLAVGSVIPSVFPFFVLSDFLSAYPITKSRISAFFSKLTGFSECSFSAFLIGIVAGGPSSAKCVANLYTTHHISRQECERLIGVSSFPSMPFVISFVGLSIKDSVIFGLKIYICLISSAVLISAFTKTKRTISSDTREIVQQNFNIVSSINTAGLNSLSITSFVVFFSIFTGMLSLLIKSELLSIVISSLLEVGSTISSLSSSKITNQILLYFILGFSLGFSGGCIHCQVINQFPKELSIKKYMLYKLTQGIMCALIFPIVLSI